MPDQFDERQKRQSADEAKDRIAVRKALSPLVRPIDAMHRECALLNALLARAPDDGALHIRAFSLARDVNQALVDLENATAALLPRQRHHSRIDDMRRTLEQLRSATPRVTEELLAD